MSDVEIIDINSYEFLGIKKPKTLGKQTSWSILCVFQIFTWTISTLCEGVNKFLVSKFLVSRIRRKIFYIYIDYWMLLLQILILINYDKVWISWS